MAVDSNDRLWSVEMEVNLFHAMRGHKPAGVNRHFQMVAIHDRLSLASKKITSEDVWNHLSRLYDLQALNESEIVPFPNKNSEFEFSDDDLTDLCEKNFPRTSYINTPVPDVVVKQESQTKSSTKSSKQDIKALLQTPKSDKHESKTSGSSSKSDSRSHSSSARSESKSGHSSGSKSSSHSNSSSKPSPKRAKRTRNVPSAGASPATPSDPPSKRRR